MERPAFQFYPGDWLHDPALRMCSLAARGLWIDMMSFMHQSERYGCLKVGPKVILPANLARMVGSTLDEVTTLLVELEEAQVFSRDEEGCIYSRRMARDEEIRQARAAGGSKGGNPALKRPKDNHKVNPEVTDKVNLPPNLTPTPSSSSSVSSSSSTSYSPSTADEGEPDDLAAEWQQLKAWMHGNCGKSFTDTKIEHRWLPHLQDMGADAIRLACEEAALHGASDNPAYTLSILASWQTKGVRSLEDAQGVLAAKRAPSTQRGHHGRPGSGGALDVLAQMHADALAREAEPS